MPAKIDMELHDTDKVVKTKSGKIMRVFTLPNTSLVVLRWENGGEIPKELNGKYTGVNDALAAAKRYIAKTDSIKERRANGKNSKRETE